jgi:hypothetical protein
MIAPKASIVKPRDYPIKKPRIFSGFLLAMRAHSLSFCHVGGLKPFRTLDYVERYPFAFGEGFESIGGDGGE